MNITGLDIQNFLTIGKAKLELDTRGLLLIQGKNGDDPSAESNGAGKSSIVDAICWCLYGTTARGVASDAVVNKTAKRDCLVTVTLVDGDKEYRIARHRKHSVGKNMVTVSERDLTTGLGADISKGTDKETQDVINKVMGCSLDVFMAAVYAGQERMPDLPGMTDKMLKTLIEEAAGVEVLTEAYAVARSRYTVAKAALDTVINEQNQTIANDSRLGVELASYECESKAFEDTRRDRAKAELSNVLPLTKDIAEAESSLKAHDEAATRKEVDDITDKLKAHKTEEAEHARFVKLAADLEREANRLKTEAAIMKRNLDNARLALTNIDAQIGKPCGECGKTYCEHDLEAARKVRADDIYLQIDALKVKAGAYRAVQDSVVTAQEVATKFKDAMTDVSAVAARQRDLSSVLNSIDAAKRGIVAKKDQIALIKVAANAKLTEANPWTKAVESKQAERDRNTTWLHMHAESVAKKGAEVEMLTDAVKVFGPAGVRAHILDTVTPYLNDRTQEYLGALADGNIHAVWATLSKTAKGDLKEKFNIEVTNDKGAESFAGLSGGEKRKVRLATSMALQDMVAGRASKPINIYIADEIDHALDEAGLERLMGVLERKARERGTVLVISHNSLSDWIDNVITVTKTGGLATVSGATERGF